MEKLYTQYRRRVLAKRQQRKPKEDGDDVGDSARSKVLPALADVSNGGGRRPSRGCRRRRDQLLPGLRHHLGRRPRQGARRRAAPHPLPRPLPRLRLPVQGGVPLCQGGYADKARRRQLRRHRRRLLLAVGRGAGGRRDRLRVPGQPQRGALHGAHQHLHAGEGGEGAAVQALVRPHQGLPHLLHPLEQAPRRVRTIVLCSYRRRRRSLLHRLRDHAAVNCRFVVDGIPIRDFKNMAGMEGMGFPGRRPMRLYCSLWSADQWATRGGLVKTDWSQAPFVASYRGFRVAACPTPPGCGTGAAWLGRELDPASRRRLLWVRRRHMIYDYCADARRFPQRRPPECTRAAPRS